MIRCPKCNSELVISDSYIVEVQYKIVGAKKGKTVVKKETPNSTNFIDSKVKCIGCGLQMNYTKNMKGEIVDLWNR